MSDFDDDDFGDFATAPVVSSAHVDSEINKIEDLNFADADEEFVSKEAAILTENLPLGSSVMGSDLEMFGVVSIGSSGKESEAFSISSNSSENSVKKGEIIQQFDNFIPAVQNDQTVRNLQGSDTNSSINFFEKSYSESNAEFSPQQDYAVNFEKNMNEESIVRNTHNSDIGIHHGSTVDVNIIGENFDFLAAEKVTSELKEIEKSVFSNSTLVIENEIITTIPVDVVDSKNETTKFNSVLQEESKVKSEPIFKNDFQVYERSNFESKLSVLEPHKNVYNDLALNKSNGGVKVTQQTEEEREIKEFETTSTLVIPKSSIVMDNFDVFSSDTSEVVVEIFPPLKVLNSESVTFSDNSRDNSEVVVEKVSPIPDNSIADNARATKFDSDVNATSEFTEISVINSRSVSSNMIEDELVQLESESVCFENDSVAVKNAHRGLEVAHVDFEDFETTPTVTLPKCNIVMDNFDMFISDSKNIADTSELVVENSSLMATGSLEVVQHVEDDFEEFETAPTVIIADTSELVVENSILMATGSLEVVQHVEDEFEDFEIAPTVIIPQSNIVMNNFDMFNSDSKNINDTSDLVVETVLPIPESSLMATGSLEVVQHVEDEFEEFETAPTVIIPQSNIVMDNFDMFNSDSKNIVDTSDLVVETVSPMQDNTNTVMNFDATGSLEVVQHVEDEFEDFEMAPAVIIPPNIPSEPEIDDFDDFAFAPVSMPSSEIVVETAPSGKFEASFDDDDDFQFNSAPVPKETVTAPILNSSLQSFLGVSSDEFQTQVYSKHSEFNQYLNNVKSFWTNEVAYISTGPLISDLIKLTAVQPVRTCSCGAFLFSASTLCLICGKTIVQSESFRWKESAAEKMLLGSVGLKVAKVDDARERIVSNVTRPDRSDTVESDIRFNLPNSSPSQGIMEFEVMDFGTASVKSSPKQSPVQHVVISNTAKNTMADYGFDFFSTESQATKAPNVSLVPVNNQVLIEVNDSASKESLPAIPKKFAPQATDESDDWGFQSANNSQEIENNIKSTATDASSVDHTFDFFASQMPKSIIESQKKEENLHNSIPSKSLPADFMKLLDSLPDLTYLNKISSNWSDMLLKF